jgi:outer membrane protein TolC
MSKTLTIFLLAALALPLPASAQDEPASPDSALHALLQAMEGTHLTLQQALDAAIGNATTVKRAEAASASARGSVRRESGLFDPELFFNMNYIDQQAPTASFFSGASVLMTTETDSRTGIRMDLPIGTRLEAAMNTVRLKTNSSFANLNPQLTTYGSLSIRQPLLGGFMASGRKALNRSEHEADAALARYDQEVIATSAEVERRYWDLYAAERNYAVQQLIVSQAESFLKDTEVRTTTGLAGPNQLANARTFLAEQKLQLIDRRERLDQLSDQFASYIGLRPTGAGARFLAADAPPEQFASDPADSLVARAFRSNLELRASASDVEAARASATAAGWGVLPKLDVIGSIGGNGLGGTPQDVIFGGDTLRTTRGGSLTDALHDVTRRNFPTWSIGLELKIPIGLRNGLGEKDRTDAEVVIAEQRLLERQRSLEDQVRSSYRELQNGEERLAAAREGVSAAQEQVRIGLIEFHNGRSTAFELVRLGADYASAQQRYSEALVRTAKAAATLRQLTSGGQPPASNQ